MSVGFWVCAVVTLVSAGVSFGFSVAGLRGSAGKVRTVGLYACARSIALLAVAVVALFAGSVPFIAAVALAMVLVQGADAAIGLTIRDWTKTVGPAVIALINLGSLIWLLVD
jgi:hypothetical protein